MEGDKLICRHCLLPVREDSTVKDSEGRVFCCHGCRDVYHLLRSEDLEEFYEKRKGWKPGPVETGPVSVEAFRDSIVKKDNYEVLDLSIGGIRCASCVWLIEKFLKRQEGVVSVRVNYGTHAARVVFDPEKTTLRDVLESFLKIGYRPLPATEAGVLEATIHEARDLLVRFGTGAFFSMQVMLISVALYAGYFQGISPLYKKIFQAIAWALATPVVFYAGHGFLKGLVRSVKNLSPSMDTLVGLGSMTAYLYSVVMVFRGGEVYFDSACMIVTIVLLGRYIETSARVRALKALLRFVEVYPQKAKLLRPDGTTEEVPVEDVKVGEVIEVLHSERLPLDGELLDEATELDESPITGEAMPVKKQRGDEVFAGTINLGPQIRVRVKKRASESLLKAVVKAVQEAQARKPPVQRVVDRVSGVFVTGVVLLAIVAGVYWAISSGPREAMLNAVAVLVVACPCALGLATPLALLQATTNSSEKGIVVKDTSAFERMPSSDVVCFDKTGTLTETTLRLRGVVTYGQLDEETLLDMAWALESKTLHPLRRVFYREREAFSAETVEIEPGKGVKGRTGVHHVVLGSGAYLRELGITLPELEVQPDEMAVYMAVDGQLEAVFFIEAPLKERAAEVVEFFKKKGLRPVILSGDREDTVREVARRLSIEEFYGGLTPFDKAEYIRNLMLKDKRVIMVGDGINDGPALKEAHLGIASHNATDLAVEASEVALLREDVSLLVDLFNLSKKTLRIIKENLLWAFTYNMVTIPLAVTGKLHPIVSAILMVISSVFVVLNSLRVR